MVCGTVWKRFGSERASHGPVVRLEGFARTINLEWKSVKSGPQPMNGSSHSTDSVSGEYDPDTQTYHIYHDWKQPTSISTTVVLGVAAINGDRPEGMEPLHHVINPDALDKLYQPISGDPSARHNCVSFLWEGHDVTVYADGEIVISVPKEYCRGIIPRDMSRVPLDVVKRLLTRGKEVFQRVIGS